MKNASGLTLYLEQNGYSQAIAQGQVILGFADSEVKISHWGLAKLKQPSEDELAILEIEAKNKHENIIAQQLDQQGFLDSISGLPYGVLSQDEKDKLLVYALTKIGIVDSQGFIAGS